MALTQITEKGIKDGEIVNADINASAAIAKSKLASLDIVNADINASADIALSKLDTSGTANNGTFLRGDGAWTAVSSTTINNNADNRVITGSGTADTLNGESGLTYDGSQLSVTSTGTPSVYIGGANPGIKFEDTNATGTPLSYIYASDGQLSLRADDSDETGSSLIEFKVDGSSKMTIDSSGKVGIGHDSPNSFSSAAHTLVLNTGSGNCGLTISTSAADQIGSIFFAEGSGSTGDGRIRYEHANNAMAFSTDNTERMRIDSSGNVIIGATSYQNGGFGGTSSGINIAGTQPQILLHETDTDKDGYFGLAGSILRIQTADSIPVTIWTNDTERMRIDSSGNVGIGTTTPSSFNSDGRNLVVGTGSGGQGLSIYSANNNYGNIYFADGTSDGSYNAGGILYNHSSNFMRFDTAAAERMRIDSSGNVGINDTAPVGTLHLKAHTNSWPGGLILEDPDGNTGWNIHPDNSDDLMIGRNSNTTTTSSNVTHIASFNSNGLAFTAGKGIDFSATSHASGMTSELLEDYEEGTYTPVVGAAGWNATSGEADGSYTKVGNLVTVHIRYESSSFSSVGMSDALYVTLPFTAKSGGNTKGTLMISEFSIASQNISWIGADVRNNQSNALFHYHNGNNNNTNNLTKTNANNQLNFKGTVVYQAA